MRFDFQAFLPDRYDDIPFRAEDLIGLEDEAGVERFVVMAEPVLRPDNAGLAGRIGNDPRMIGCASVNPTLGTEAAEALRLVVAKYAFKGVKLSPTAHGYDLDAEVVDPVLREARALGLPVTVDGDGERCTPRQVAAVAGRFPDLAFIADMGFRPHVTPGGTGDILDAARQRPNLFLGFTALTASEPHHLQTVVAALGPERVVFGSHAPSGIPLFAVEGIRRANLGAEAEAMIFGETLRKIYGL